MVLQPRLLLLFVPARASSRLQLIPRATPQRAVLQLLGPPASCLANTLSAQAISDAVLKKLSSSYSTFLSPGLGSVSSKASSFGSSIMASSGSTATGL